MGLFDATKFNTILKLRFTRIKIGTRRDPPTCCTHAKSISFSIFGCKIAMTSPRKILFGKKKSSKKTAREAHRSTKSLYFIVGGEFPRGESSSQYKSYIITLRGATRGAGRPPSPPNSTLRARKSADRARPLMIPVGEAQFFNNPKRVLVWENTYF